jgi:hypothetical protein
LRALFGYFNWQELFVVFFKKSKQILGCTSFKIHDERNASYENYFIYKATLMWVCAHTRGGQSHSMTNDINCQMTLM